MIPLGASNNFDEVERRLSHFQASLADNSAALRAVADNLREMIAQQFSTQGAAGGTPWAPLAPSTLRKTRGPRAGILYSTGALLGSLVDASAPGHVEETDGRELLFGSELPYAIFHQTGAGIGFGQPQLPTSPRKEHQRAGAARSSRRALPMRPLIVVSDARAESWIEMVRAEIAAKSSLLGK